MVDCIRWLCNPTIKWDLGLQAPYPIRYVFQKMRKFLTLLGAMIGLSASPATVLATLNYDEMILLDAENLAETGNKEGFQQVLISLKKHVSEPKGVEELIKNKLPSYSVKSMGVTYEIYSPRTSENESWGNATFA